MIRLSIAALAVLLAGTALAQDPDYGKPGHPGGSWGEQSAPQQEGEYDPGCTPKADVPQSLLDYFAKFKQPIPEKYCVEQPQDNAQATDRWQKETPPDVPDDRVEPEPPIDDTPPIEAPTVEVPPPWSSNQTVPLYNHGRPFGQIHIGPGEIHLNFPRFHLDLRFGPGR